MRSLLVCSINKKLQQNKFFSDVLLSPTQWQSNGILLEQEVYKKTKSPAKIYPIPLSPLNVTIAPNDCDFGRPSIAEIWELMRNLEKDPICCFFISILPHFRERGNIFFSELISDLMDIRGGRSFIWVLSHVSSVSLLPFSPKEFPALARSPDFGTFCPEVARCGASPAGVFLFGRLFIFQGEAHR